MRANHLERAGVVGTPCRECDEQIFVKTDDEGYVTGIYLDGEVVDEEDGDEAAPATPLLGVSGVVIGPLALLAGALLIAWLASSTYCSGRLPQRPSLQASTPVATPSPTAAAPVVSPTLAPMPKVMVFDNLSGVSFAKNQTALSAEAQTSLQRVVERLKAAPSGALFEIGGHTDNQGSESYNKRLSLQRAESVRQFLVKQWVSAALLQVKGYGGAKPVMSNESEEGKEKNRRIEITRVK
jgi:outer membrane protein OmpA-like peptidoglycan-associated protein